MAASSPWAALFATMVTCGAAQAAQGAGVEAEGLYQHTGQTAATLEVRRVPEGYTVKLRGGVVRGKGVGSPADCALQAHGTLRSGVFEAWFDPVETETFSYGAEDAARERRLLRILFWPGSARVAEADTFGYCGLGATFLGQYRQVSPAARRARAAESR